MWLAVKKVGKTRSLMVGLTPGEMKQFMGGLPSLYDLNLKGEASGDAFSGIVIKRSNSGAKLTKGGGQGIEGKFYFRPSALRIVNNSVRQEKVIPKVIRQGTIEIPPLPSHFQGIPPKVPDPREEGLPGLTPLKERRATIDDLFEAVKLVNEIAREVPEHIEFGLEEKMVVFQAKYTPKPGKK